MVKITEKEGKQCYQCEECKFLYKDKELADKCEKYCKKHHGCNIEITQFAVNS